MSEGVTTQQHAALIAYPKQAAFGRTLPKNKIYERSGANTRLKDLFVEQVEQVVWQYKLAPGTTNLPAQPGVSEIQIFSVQLKSPELHEDVLRCIDGAVQFPIIFELTQGRDAGARTRVVAAYKRPGPTLVANPSMILSTYFSTDWLVPATQRTPMPVAVDLAGLYEQLLHRLMPVPPRPQETLPDLVSRIEQIAAKQRDVERIEARLAKEKQFNRKVQINAALRQLRTDLIELQR